MPAPRATVVDETLSHYIAAHSTPPDMVQRQLMAATQAKTGDRAGMQIGSDQGMFFEMFARALGAHHVIEIGTFTGYSALSLARGIGPNGRLICCDVSEEWTAIAREHWELAGVADRIDLRIAPALDTIAALPADQLFDLAFIDADKPNYWNYFDALLPHMTNSGVMLVDNTLWSRKVMDHTADDHDTAALRTFNQRVAADPRVRCVVLPIGDGVTMIQLAND